MKQSLKMEVFSIFVNTFAAGDVYPRHGVCLCPCPCHCVKSVRIRSFSGPYSVRMWENTDQKTSEYGHFSRSVSSRKFTPTTANAIIQNTNDFLLLFIAFLESKSKFEHFRKHDSHSLSIAEIIGFERCV